MGKYYVYIFYKPDENKTPFYVGIGSIYSDGRERIDFHFLYAKNPKHQPNKLFYNTLRKLLNNNQMPIVEKIAENLSIEDASELEKDLIRKFGRKIDKTGTLCNITDGGEGWSGEQPHKWKKVVQLDLQGNLLNIWESIKQAAIETKSSKNDISSVCRGERKKHNGFIWLFFNDYETNLDEQLAWRTTPHSFSKNRKIYQFDLNGILLKTWVSAKQAAEYIGINRSSISMCCNGKQKQAGGFIWKFTE